MKKIFLVFVGLGLIILPAIAQAEIYEAVVKEVFMKKNRFGLEITERGGRRQEHTFEISEEAVLNGCKSLKEIRTGDHLRITANRDYHQKWIISSIEC